MTQCFADSNKNYQPIDVVLDGKGEYSGETLEETQKRYPGAVLMDLDEAHSLYESRFIKPPVELTEDEFWYWLECLPPGGYFRSDDTESFYVTEMICGDVATHCVRIADKYYRFDDHVMRSHVDRVNHVKESLK